MKKQQKSSRFQRWQSSVKKPNHTVQVAVLALLITLSTFTFSLNAEQQSKWDTENLYMKQLDIEIGSNLHQIETYENEGKPDEDGRVHIQVPIVPVTAVYEAGLQNGIIVRLSASTQNSLFTAYTYAQRVTQQSSDYRLEDAGSDQYKTRNAITGMFIDAYKVNLQDTRTRGLLISNPFREAREVTFWATSLLVTSIIVQIGVWSIVTILTRPRTRP